MNIRVALAQIDPTVGDLEGNRKIIVHFLEEARRAQADLVTFPELAVTGYPPEDLLFKKSFLKANELSVRRILPHTKGITCVIGFVHASAGHLYNASALLSHSRFCGVYHKNHLPNYGVFDEKRYFSSGGESFVFSQGNARIGLSICEDLWVEKGPPFIEAKEGGARLLINISASPYEVGKQAERQRLFSRHARESGAHLLYNNLVGGQDELVFDGGSMIFDERGRLLQMAPQFKEALLVCDLEIPPPKKGTQKKHAIVVCRLPGKKVTEKLALPAQKPHTPLSREEEIYRALVLGTRDYVRKNGFQKVVLGLSGGIDSSLVACIAVDALGKEDVVGVSMPSLYSSRETREDAKSLAGRLGIRCAELPIDTVFQSLLGLLSEIFKGKKEGIAVENLQARIRGLLLMALSNQFGWLVLTTGNKSEMSTGYCTLYGDMAGGFAVIKDVPETWVYELAHFRNREEPVIPETVIAREPTAELKPNQKDSDTLPPYEVLDPILTAYIEKNLTLSQMKRQGLREEIVKEVIRRVDGNEYKRRQGPPGVKITPRAFGKDWRLPITNRYRDGETS